MLLFILVNMLDLYSMFIFSFFLSLIYGFQLNIIRSFTSHKRAGLFFWSLAFFIISFGDIISVLSMYFNTITFFWFFITPIVASYSFLCLYLGWKSFFGDKTSRRTLITLLLIPLSIIPLYMFRMIDLIYLLNIIYAGSTVLIISYLMKKQKEKHRDSTPAVIVLIGIALISALIIFTAGQLPPLRYNDNILFDHLKGLSTILQITCHFLSMTLAVMHRSSEEDLLIIHEKEDMAKELEALSLTDPLTEINNRRGFLRILEYEFNQLKRNSSGYSLVLGDIDFFKKVNDTWGHDCGDLVIKSISATIVENIRNQDSLARWGGEEFIILLKGGDLADNQTVIERIRKKIENLRISFHEETISVTLSFGLADALENDENSEAAIIRADKMLYKAKDSGRNKVIIHSN